MENTIYQDALKNAVASVEMEGYNVSKNQKEIGLNFLSGKISKEDFINQILQGCRS